MKHYIIWTSSKGAKDIYTIVSTYWKACDIKNELNNWFKENNRKARAYITSCIEEEEYEHTEM